MVAYYNQNLRSLVAVFLQKRGIFMYQSCSKHTYFYDFKIKIIQNQKKLQKTKFNANGFCKGFHCGNKMTNPHKIITNETRFGNDKMYTSKATAFRKRKQTHTKRSKGS